MYTVYKTDNLHSYISRDLIGLATTFKKAIKLIKQQANNEGEKISKDQLFNLDNYKQTQGYDEGEFLIEEVQTNTLL